MHNRLFNIQYYSNERILLLFIGIIILIVIIIMVLNLFTGNGKKNLAPQDQIYNFL